MLTWTFPIRHPATFLIHLLEAHKEVYETTHWLKRHTFNTEMEFQTQSGSTGQNFFIMCVDELILTILVERFEVQEKIQCDEQNGWRRGNWYFGFWKNASLCDTKDYIKDKAKGGLLLNL